MIFLIIGVFLFTQANAQVRSNLFTKKEEPAAVKSKTLPAIVVQKQVSSESSSSKPLHQGNLPIAMHRKIPFEAEGSFSLTPSKLSLEKLRSLPSGSVIDAEILESAIALSGSKAPIRAKVTRGDLKGLTFIGEASLEPNSKRILIEFNSLTYQQAQIAKEYQLKAHGLDLKGILGLEGKYTSGEGKYFTAEFLSAFTAGYADSTIKRNKNSDGNYVEEPGPDTYTKKALASALASTSNYFGEKLKKAPELSVLEGPIQMQILITEQPKLKE